MTSAFTPRVDEVVEALEGVLAHLADRLRAVRLAGGVADVHDRLVRQLVDDRPGHGEATEAGVEDADRGIRAARRRTVQAQHARLGGRRPPTAGHATHVTRDRASRPYRRTVMPRRSLVTAAARRSPSCSPALAGAAPEQPARAAQVAAPTGADRSLAISVDGLNVAAIARLGAAGAPTLPPAARRRAPAP